MANSVIPQGVHKVPSARNVVIGSLVVLVLAGTVVGTMASQGHSSVKKVASSPSRVAPQPVYTPPASVAPYVFPPAPIVPTPRFVSPAPVRTAAPTPVRTAAPTPVRTVAPKLGPQQLSFAHATVITDGASSAKVQVLAPRFYTSNNSPILPMTPKYGFYEVLTVGFTGVTGKFDENEFSFYIRGEDGIHYTGALVAGFDPQLTATTLTPGEPVKGNIVFDVPTKTGTLVYESGGEALKEWK
jgi:hypothetical protein